MKIVYIADIGIEGGATKSLVELMSTMKSDYHITPVVLTSRKNKLNAILDALGIENHTVGHGAFLQGAPDVIWKKPIKYVLYAFYYYTHFHSSIRKALHVIDWSSVDLIHTNVARDDLGMELSKQLGIPNICHIREFAERDFNCWSYKPHYIRYLVKYTNQFIAISDAIKEYWMEKGLPTERIEVVYNGVDRSKISITNKNNWYSEQLLRIVIVGNVIPNKGQWQAVEALCTLPERIRKNIRLDIIGNITESYKNKLIAPLKKHKILDQVQILGGCSDIHDRLKEYHIGLMCSKAEGFGRVTVEYMHAGLTVIASNTGANLELIDNGRTGLIYDYDNIKSLASCVEKLYYNRDLLIELANNGQLEANMKFTKELNANRIYNVYLGITS